MSPVSPRAKFTCALPRDMMELLDILCDAVGISRTEGIQMAVADTLRRFKLPSAALGWPTPNSEQLNLLDVLLDALEAERLAAEDRDRGPIVAEVTEEQLALA